MIVSVVIECTIAMGNGTSLLGYGVSEEMVTSLCSFVLLSLHVSILSMRISSVGTYVNSFILASIYACAP
jgi:hypothetical protein